MSSTTVRFAADAKTLATLNAEIKGLKALETLLVQRAELANRISSLQNGAKPPSARIPVTSSRSRARSGRGNGFQGPKLAIRIQRQRVLDYLSRQKQPKPLVNIFRAVRSDLSQTQCARNTWSQRVVSQLRENDLIQIAHMGRLDDSAPHSPKVPFFVITKEGRCARHGHKRESCHALA